MALALAFFVVAALIVGSAAIVVFSRNVIYSAFALLGAFMGVVGIYMLLTADFVAMVQLLVYVGGILILTIFAVMLTQGIGEVNVSNRSVTGAGAALTALATFTVLTYGIVVTHWKIRGGPSQQPTTYRIGEALLSTYLLPFEVASVVLLMALVGAAVICRRATRPVSRIAENPNRQGGAPQQ